MLKDPRARILLIHLAAYAVVVAICAGVNLWLSPDKLWFVWVALGWGIGVAAHGLAVYLCLAHRRERIFIDPKARAFTVHLFAYLAVVVLLFVVNLTVTPNRWWFYWVALGWGAGVVAHAWAVFGRRKREESSTVTAQTASPPKRKASAAKKQSTPRKKSAAPRKRPTPKA